MPRTRAAEAPEAAAARPRLLAPADVDSTKSKILDAAFRRLAQEGYAALSVREIAKDAGVNHALINYHFRTKDQLVIAVLDEANRQLLARQQRMYRRADRLRAEMGGGAALLRRATSHRASCACRPSCGPRACRTPSLREKFLPRILAWKQLVLGGGARGARDAAKRAAWCCRAPFTRRGRRHAGSRSSGSAWSSRTCSA